MSPVPNFLKAKILAAEYIKKICSADIKISPTVPLAGNNSFAV